MHKGQEHPRAGDWDHSIPLNLRVSLRKTLISAAKRHHLHPRGHTHDRPPLPRDRPHHLHLPPRGHTHHPILSPTDRILATFTHTYAATPPTQQPYLSPDIHTNATELTTHTCLPRRDTFQPFSTPTQRRLSTFNLIHDATVLINAATPDNRDPLRRDQPLRPYLHQRGFAFQPSKSSTRRHLPSVPVPNQPPFRHGSTT